MKKWLTILVVSLGLSACAGIGGGILAPVTPETPRESLVAAEAAYEFALLEVRTLVLTGVIVSGTDLADSVAFVITETRTALDAWHVNPDNPNLMVAAQSTLRALQAKVARLIAIENSQYPDGWSDLAGVMA